ncbi:cytochrome P450 monooxygenase [Xylogone sp. PMI_703]|nr:cytochrome P450 monooxygenase [Xylogone sp. PMI_703]
MAALLDRFFTRAILPYCIFFISTVVLYFTAKKYIRRQHYLEGKLAKGCGSVKKYKHRDRLFGTDLAIDMRHAIQNHYWLRWQENLFESHQARTVQANFLGTRTIFSTEAENMKAMSTSNWRDFGVNPLRYANGAATPFTGPGVSLSDGDYWEYSRNLIKPYFDRSAFRDLSRLGEYTDRLLELLPKDNSTFDLQPLMLRWALDNASQLIFGESQNSLIDPGRTDIATAMVKILNGLRVRLQMGQFLFLHRDKEWEKAITLFRRYMKNHIDRTLAQVEQYKKTGKQPVPERTDLMWEVAQQVQEPELLHAQISGVWFPSTDTTSIFISNVFYALARNPSVYAKLREEVLLYGDVPLTFELLRKMKYLNWVLNETHRIYPNAVEMVRIALVDTTLPIGGGPNEDQPIFIQKGDIVRCNRYILHRDPKFWGEDSEEFRPERWSDIKPLWYFVPFGGGPRICPAHTLVAIEASYVIFNIVKRFKEVQPRDPMPYTPLMNIALSSRHGVKISLVPA